MKVIGNMEKAGARIAALGTFDGVHKGHAELLRAGREYADAHGILLRAYTFDRHPLSVLAPSRAPRLLSTLREKTDLMAQYGTDEVRVLPFTAETAQMDPETFIDALEAETTLRAVVAGWNYTFGKKGTGDAEMLRGIGKKRGFDVLIVDPVMTETGKCISSTAIRESLEKGDMTGARELLGYDYTLTGDVVTGNGIGRRIGFPTANIRVPSEKLLPNNGVYICRMRIGGAWRETVANIGSHPTFPSDTITVEAHVLNGYPDIYGQTVSLKMLERIRGEKRFDSGEALAAQIGEDIRRAGAYFRMEKTDK